MPAASASVRRPPDQCGGAYRAADIIPLWKRHLRHDGVRFPEPFADTPPLQVRLLRRRPAGAEGRAWNVPSAARPYVRMLGALAARAYPHLRTPGFVANFQRDLAALLRENGAPPAPPLLTWDLNALARTVLAEKEQQRRRRHGDPKKKKAPAAVQLYAYVDGEPVAVARSAVDRPGIFVGRSASHPWNGRIRRPLTPRDVTLNMSPGAPVPSPVFPRTDARRRGVPDGREDWGGVVHERDVNWIARWADPVSGEFKYVYLDPAAAVKQRHERRKFETARAFHGARERVMQHLYADVRAVPARATDDPKRWQAAVCVALIDAFALRVGNGDQRAEDATEPTAGAVSLRVENISVGGNGNRGAYDDGTAFVRLHYVGKDHVTHVAERSVAPDLAAALSALRAGKPPSALLFHGVSAADVNAYLERLLPGLSAKALRTEHASALVDARLLARPRAEALARAVRKTGGDPTLRRALTAAGKRAPSLALIEAACALNHRKNVDASGTAGARRTEAAVIRQQLRDAAALTGALGKAWDAFDAAVASAESTATASEFAAAFARVQERARALGINPATTKANYVDPRVLLAFCARAGLPPVPTVFSSRQASRFAWAAQAASRSFRF